jgi:glycolate oxidase iron-sulfur subunit
MESFLPPVPKHVPLPKQSWAPGEKKGEAQLFYGCVMDIFYNHVNNASIRLLTKQKRIVSTPEQTCCGALAHHAGEVEIAKDLAKRNIEYFERVKGEIVVTSAGCGAMLKEYGELLAGDPDWSERAHEFSARVKDICETLAAGEFSTAPGKLDKKVAYHAACHLYNVQKIREAPLSLLKQIPGLTLIPLQEAEQCCGSAGIYNLIHTDLSLKVLDRKMSFLKATGADAVVTTNPGCLLQLEAGIAEEKLPMKVYHLVELLDEAFNS